MSTLLVTGGTGTLGRPTVDLLRRAGHDVRVLSRTTAEGRVVGDLTSGAGVPEALDGVDTVVHLATSGGAKDVAQAERLVEAARAAGVAHIVMISIVGIDDIPFAYYRAKRAAEAVIEHSGLPFTILRATQFHDFVANYIGWQRWSPALLALDVPDQPIAVEEVAARLVELVDAGPSGRVPDIGGPEQLPLRELLRTWQRATGSRRPVWRLPLGGRTIRAFQAGHHLTALPGFGRETFAEFAERTVRGTNDA